MKTQMMLVLATMCVGTGFALAQPKPVVPSMSASDLNFRFEATQDGVAGLINPARPDGVKVSVLPGHIYQVAVVRTSVGVALEKVAGIVDVKVSVPDELKQRPAKTYLVRGRSLESLLDLISFAESVVSTKDQAGVRVFANATSEDWPSDPTSVGVLVTPNTDNGYRGFKLTELKGLILQNVEPQHSLLQPLPYKQEQDGQSATA